jgi:acyl-coenzyme A synthetase/AMP-(fatty) acid ligase
MNDLASAVTRGEGAKSAEIVSNDRRLRQRELRNDCGVAEQLEMFRNKTVVVVADQLTFSAVLMDLDGLAGQIVICPPDLTEDLVEWAVGVTGASHLVTDRVWTRPLKDIQVVPTGPSRRSDVNRSVETQWLLFTSGTTGAPKLVSHRFESLTGAFGAERDETIVWGTFYDVRRYGGLQILLRALVGGSSLILSHEDEPMSSHLRRLGENGVTHLTGTPSHWRSALWNPEIGKIAPRYVRLSGENVDQAVLDALKSRFPSAKVVHAFAATETGVAFEVHDGLAGFPSSFLQENSDVALKVADGSLRIRSHRCATRYANAVDRELKDQDGFVDTGDLVEVRGDRCYFLGRRGGVINIGGLKVHPEEVEAVINRHPKVLASFVRARPNPILGAIVIAEVVLKSEYVPLQDETAFVADLAAYCRDSLGSYKTPAVIRIVESLKMSAAGKLARHG